MKASNIVPELPSQNLFDPFGDLRRLIDNRLGQFLNLFPGGGLHIHPAFLCLGQELGILQSLRVRFTQDFHPIGRDARCDRKGAPKFTAGKDDVTGERRYQFSGSWFCAIVREGILESAL